MKFFPRPAKRRTASLFGGIGLGAALMYLLDPDRGARRRALVRDKAVRFGRWTGQRLGARSRDLRNRAQGLAARVRRDGTGQRPGDDVLEARVRAGIGHEVRNPGAIHVSARRGRVALTGPILEEEKEALLARVEAVEGVEEVEDRLEAHASAGEVSALQGSQGPPGKADQAESRFENENA